MLRQRQKIEKVAGQEIPPPRWTFGAFFAAVKYFIGPFLLILIALDLLGYLYFRYILESCYGIVCFFE